MSKVATYLQGHLLGEVVSRTDVRNKYADTASVIHRVPELVISPRNTNDVRKVARFAWQLAEKGHKLSITPRGGGTDPTGGSASSGIALVTETHLNKIFEYDQKQQLLRVQPGATYGSINSALGLHQSRLAVDIEPDHATIGGAIGFGELRPHVAKLWADRLEVVLDNGDAIQTGIISKRDFNKRRGLQGREGDIYRGIDAVLENHADLIAKMQDEEWSDRSGYPGISHVEQKNGSVDLTPLFIGSQGTLGIVTEMIVRAEYAPEQTAYAAALFSDGDKARDALEELERFSPSHIEYIDGRYVGEAMKQGNKYKWFANLSPDDLSQSTLLIVGFDMFKSRKRKQILKKIVKKLSKMECAFTTSETDDVETLRNAISYMALSSVDANVSAPVTMPGFYIPIERLEKFVRELVVLEEQLDVGLPLYGDVISGRYSIQSRYNLLKTSDKQKLLKVIDRVSALVSAVGGDLIARGSEGRLLSRFVRSQWTEEYQHMMDEIKHVFDPHGILNPGVKQDVELRELVGELRSDNNIAPELL